DPEVVGENAKTYLAGKLIDKFTKEQPEKAILVAPFTDISRFYINEKEVEVRRSASSKIHGRSSKDDTAKSLFSAFYDSFDKSKVLLETVIRSEEAQAVPSRVTALIDTFLQH